VNRNGNGNNTPVNRNGNGNNTPVNRNGNGNNTPVNRNGNGNNTPVNRNGNGNNTPPTNNRINPPTVPKPKPISFGNIEIGVLGPDDFVVQGRYYDYYEFEGKENQLINIIFSGSNDGRDTSNLSLNPVEIIVFDSDGNIISRETSNQNKTSSISAQLPSTGSYTIAVSNQSPGDVGRYSYKVSLQAQ
ncbi:MAG: pre-peptidase C-terminal domain-containing protein, partial [Cyanobacteria bacterium P01_D01_bin.116]